MYESCFVSLDSDIITDARQEAERILLETEQATAEANTKSATAIIDARQSAARIIEEAQQSSIELVGKA
jgi:F0F1-type ATP synthase membrane subunit b/b'